MNLTRSLQRLRQYLKPGRKPRRASPPRRKLYLENLEGRTLLSCGFNLWSYDGNTRLDVDCDSAPDTVTLTAQNGAVVITANGNTFSHDFSVIDRVRINTGGGNDTVNVERTPQYTLGEFARISVEVGAGNDTVHISPVARNLSNIAGALEVDDKADGWLALHINDQAHSSNSTYKLDFDMLDGTLLTRSGAAQINYNSSGGATWSSNSSVTINGGSGSTTWDVDETGYGHYMTVLNTGTGVNTVEVFGNHSPLTINGQDGLDTVTIPGSAERIERSVHVTNLSSWTALTISDKFSDLSRTATLSATGLTGLASAPITWVENDLRSLEIVGSDAGNTFTVTDTPANFHFQGTTLHSGTGADAVNVQATSNFLTVHGQSGVDTVTLGSTGSVQQIVGGVSITNAAQRTALIINDSANPLSKNATLYATYLAGMLSSPTAGINWVPADLLWLKIYGGGGGNTFTVEGTPTNAAFGGVQLFTGSYPDTVRVRATQSALTIDAGYGDDTIEVGNAFQILDPSEGALTVVGGTNTDALHLKDGGNFFGHSYTVAAGAVTRNSMPSISHSGIETLSVQAGNGTDDFTVASLTMGLAVSLAGGGGTNSLYGPNALSNWSITSNNAGTFIVPSSSSFATFTQFGHLIGGSANDNFCISEGFALSGALNGGGGTNKLDYSLYQGNVYANLSTSQATGTSSATGIQEVLGGLGNDILVGDDASNVFDGGAGRDLLIGDGAGNTQQPDLLQGGAGEDIVIAGWTNHDQSASTLQSIRDQWAGPGSYADRVAALTLYLNAETMHSNDAPSNQVYGGTELDWFFLRPGIDSHDGGEGETIVTLLV